MVIHIEKWVQVYFAYQAYIAKSITLILVAFLAWNCGSLFWLIQAPKTEVSQWSPSNIDLTKKSEPNDDSLVSILEGAVFGRYVEPKKTDSTIAGEKRELQQQLDNIENVPETRLNLILVGVVSSSNPEFSLAVITYQGEQNTYGIGETIDGTRASIQAIDVDRIIILNNGRDEVLILDGIEEIEEKRNKMIETSTASETKEIADGAIDNSSQNSEQDELNNIKQEIAKNPQSILKYIRLSQVNRDGKLLGYRISPGRDRTLFDSVGLQPDDLAVSLNGEDLTDPKTMTELWQNIDELTELDLMVEREGQQYNINISL